MLIYGENTYMTVEEANDIVNSCLLTTSDEYINWNKLLTNDKESLILSSTELFEQLLYIGRKYTDQNMQFPRLVNGDKLDTPKIIKLAIIRQGLREVIANSKYELKLKSMGIEEYKTDGASIKFSSGDKGAYSINTNGIYTDLARSIRRYTF